jgi:hypothetical protein
VSSAARPVCRPLDQPWRRARPARQASAAGTRHQRTPSQQRPGRCGGIVPPLGERVLVGWAPRERPLATARCTVRATGQEVPWADQLTSALALLAAVVALVAAIWWTACAPVL